MELSPTLLWTMVVTLSGSTISLVLASITYGRKTKAQSDQIETGELVAKAVLGDTKELEDNRKRGGLMYRVQQIEEVYGSERRARDFLTRLMDVMGVAKNSGEYEMDTRIREAFGKGPSTPPTGGRIPTARQMIIGEQMRRLTHVEGNGDAGPHAHAGIERDRFGTPVPPAPEKPAHMPHIPRPQPPPLISTKREGLTPPPPPHPVLRGEKPKTPFPTKHAGEKEEDSGKKGDGSK